MDDEELTKNFVEECEAYGEAVQESAKSEERQHKRDSIIDKAAKRGFLTP